MSGEKKQQHGFRYLVNSVSEAPTRMKDNQSLTAVTLPDSTSYVAIAECRLRFKGMCSLVKRISQLIVAYMCQHPLTLQNPWGELTSSVHKRMRITQVDRKSTERQVSGVSIYFQSTSFVCPVFPHLYDIISNHRQLEHICS